MSYLHERISSPEIAVVILQWKIFPMDTATVDGLHNVSLFLNASLSQALADLEQVLAGLQADCASFDDLGKNLESADRAKLLTTLAYTLTSLSWSKLLLSDIYLSVSMRVSGSNISSHPIKQEIERVKAYMARVAKLSELQDEELPTIKIDKQAAHRIVSQTVGIKRSSA